MRGSALVVIGLLGVGGLSACGMLRRGTPAPTPEGPGLVKRGNMMVLTGAILHQNSQTLINVLAQHLPGIRIDAAPSCPEVYLRGRSSIANSSDATIYVDGQEAANSCILESLYAFDLDRVEVYPMGVTSRPGYRSDPDGLILIFLRRANP